MLCGYLVWTVQCIDVQIYYNYISLSSDDYSTDSSTSVYVITV